jgi:hypothetical protein
MARLRARWVTQRPEQGMSTSRSASSSGLRGRVAEREAAQREDNALAPRVRDETWLFDQIVAFTELTREALKQR